MTLPRPQLLVTYVSDEQSNPFGFQPDCERFVPGYGDANAEFHVVGDHPGVHGGVEAGVPFTGEPWSAAFLSALTEAGLLAGPAEGVAPDGVTERSPADGAAMDAADCCQDDGPCLLAHCMAPVGACAAPPVLVRLPLAAPGPAAVVLIPRAVPQRHFRPPIAA